MNVLGRLDQLVGPPTHLYPETISVYRVHLRALLDVARALEVYADARHWAIDRPDFAHPVCSWIGPGAVIKRGVPDGPATARAALAPLLEETEQ